MCLSNLFLKGNKGNMINKERQHNLIYREIQQQTDLHCMQAKNGGPIAPGRQKQTIQKLSKRGKRTAKGYIKADNSR